MIDPELLACNHHHELTDEHEWVDFGHGRFVANKTAIPLLKALHDAGLRTRSHHIVPGEPAFVSILLDPGVSVQVEEVYERSSTRPNYNGMRHVVISWK